MEEVEQICSRIAIMDKGRIIATAQTRTEGAHQHRRKITVRHTGSIRND
jgi:ABC-type multidrug transport system ATPase subunit